MKNTYGNGISGSVLSADSDLLSSLLKIRQVIEATKLSRSSIYKGVGDGTFPPPIKLGARSVAWESAAIRSWIDERIAASLDGKGTDNV